MAKKCVDDRERRKGMKSKMTGEGGREDVVRRVVEW